MTEKTDTLPPAAATDDGRSTPGARSGGRILVDALRLHGVDRVFCVPGESYLDVLDSDTRLFSAELDLAQAQYDELAAFVEIYRALGGGWQ